MSNESLAVELRRVSKRFAGPTGEIVSAVDAVSLTIRNGEFFSLLGPSGCGKTTSLRMIAGFELPTDGDVFIHGQPMGRTPPFKRQVNTVFQNYALFPHMTIGENIAFGLQQKHVSRHEIGPRVKRALEMVHLSGYEARRPRQLSGGQQQRIALARALVNRPQVLLLDEPLGALDQKLRKAMQLELKTLQREVGITFIFVTHDQEEALTMSDRIAVMSRGKVLQVGDAGEIYERPNCRFVADFIGETNFLSGVVRGQEASGIAIALADGATFYAEGTEHVAPGTEVTIAVRPEKLTLRPGPDSQAPASLLNRLTGQVASVVYIGTDTYYDVTVTGERHMRVRVQNNTPGARTLASQGETVTLFFASEAARVLTS